MNWMGLNRFGVKITSSALKRKDNPLSNSSDEPCEDRVGGEEGGVGELGEDTDERGGVG